MGTREDAMPEISSILVDLFVIFLAAKVAGELLERLGQPPVGPR